MQSPPKPLKGASVDPPDPVTPDEGRPLDVGEIPEGDVKGFTGHANLTAGTLSGLKWTYATTATMAVLQIGYQAVVGRLLSPETFGLMALVLLAMRFLKMFADIGLSRALVQKAEVTEEDVRAAFGASVLTGVVVYGVIWFAAPTIAAFFSEPEVVPALRVTALSLVVIGAMSVSDSLLHRQLRFQELAARKITCYIFGYLFVAIGLALAGFGIWSLVAGILTSHVVGGLLTYERVRHPLRPLFSWSHIKPLFGFGGRVSIISFMEWLGTNLDTVAVGRFATSALLGQYNRAFYLTSYPTSQLTRSLSSVLFPGFSRIQDDVPRIRRVFLGAVAVAAFVLLPLCVGMAVSSRELVLVVLGQQWEPAAAVLPVLAIAVAIHVMSHFAGILCEARAALNAKLALQATYLTVLVTLLFVAAGRGLWAYGAALAVGELVRHVGYVLLLRRVVELPATDLLRQYVPGLATAAVVAGLIMVGKLAATAAGWPVAAVLVAEVLLGGFGLLVMLRFGPTRRIRQVLRMRLRAAGVLRPGNRSDRIATLLMGKPERSGAMTS